MYKRFAGILMATLLASVSVYAQSTQKVEFSTPFAFQVGKESLPAGTYTVDRAAINVVLLRPVNAAGGVFVVTTPASAPKENATPKIWFHRYGDRYFLSNIWNTGSTGMSLPKSRAEKEMELSMAHTASLTVVAGYRK
jgi:hypothetical protein